MQAFHVSEIREHREGVTVDITGDALREHAESAAVSGWLEIVYPDRDSAPFEVGDSVQVYVRGEGFQVGPDW